MDVLNESNNLSESKQQSNFLLSFSTVLGILLLIAGFDTFTEKEHLDAGVDLGGEGREK